MSDNKIENSRVNNENIVNGLFEPAATDDVNSNQIKGQSASDVDMKQDADGDVKNRFSSDPRDIPEIPEGALSSETGQEEKEEAETFVLAEIDEEALKATEESLKPIELDERAIKAMDLKEGANRIYAEGRVEEALELYTEALTVCPVSGKGKERAALYGNRSACCVQLEQHKLAVRECTKALEYDAKYLKVLKRRAKCCEKTDQLELALDDYKKIVDLDPSDVHARERLFNLPREINERNEKLKAEMIGKMKDLGNMFLKPFGLSTDNFQLNQDPNTGGYNIKFNQNSSG